MSCKRRSIYMSHIDRPPFLRGRLIYEPPCHHDDFPFWWKKRMIAGRWMITGRRENIIRGFMKCGYPSSWMVISWTIHLLKWMIQGYPYFRKPPHASKCQETIPKASLCGLILSHCWTYEKHVIPHVPTIHLVLRSTQLEKKQQQQQG